MGIEMREDAKRFRKCTEEILDGKETTSENYFKEAHSLANRFMLLEKAYSYMRVVGLLRISALSLSGRISTIRRMFQCAEKAMEYERKAATLVRQAEMIGQNKKGD